MHIAVDRRDLLRALTSASRACASMKSLPVLQKVLVKVESDSLILAATDLTRHAITRIPRVILHADDPAKALVDTEKLIRLLKKNASEQVDLGILAESVDIDMGSTHISLPSSNPDEYPALPFRGEFRPLAQFRFESDILQRALADSIPTICDDETRPYLNGLAFQLDAGRPILISTDGHRMTRRFVEAVETNIDEQNSFLIPKAGIEEVLHMLKAMKDATTMGVEFMLGNDYRIAVFSTEQENAEKQPIKHELWVRLPDAEFPPWQAVWPKVNGIHISFDAEEIREVADEAKLFCSPRTKSVQLIPAEAGVTVSMDNPEQGKYVRQVGAEITGNPPAIGLNVEYIQDALRAIGGSTVTVHMGGVLDATLWSSDEPGCEVVVMPVRG